MKRTIVYIVLIVALLLPEPLPARNVPEKKSKRQFVIGALLGEVLAPLFGAALGTEALGTAALGTAALGTGYALSHSHIYQPVQVQVQKPPTPEPTSGKICEVGVCLIECSPVGFEEYPSDECESDMKCCGPEKPTTTTTPYPLHAK